LQYPGQCHRPLDKHRIRIRKNALAPVDVVLESHANVSAEQDGHGVLIINASTVLHLNQTAAEYAYYFVNNIRAEEVGRRVSQRYHVSSEQARRDYQDTTDRILTVIEMHDPIRDLSGFERRSLLSRISAPYRLVVHSRTGYPQTLKRTGSERCSS
jgi:hypothetical protein